MRSVLIEDFKKIPKVLKAIDKSSGNIQEIKSKAETEQMSLL